jgi:hypothetical protein
MVETIKKDTSTTTTATTDANVDGDNNIFTYADPDGTWDTDPSSYTWELQRIYNYGTLDNDPSNYGDENFSATNLNQPLDEDLATQAIDSLGIDFGDYKDTLVSAITGMTAVEAHIYLRDILNELDTKDGTVDNEINSSEFATNPTDFITDVFANAEFSTNTQADTTEIQQRFLDAADEYKDEDDPTDENNIELLRSAQQDGSYDESNLSDGAKAAAIQNEDSTNALGVTDPELADLAEEVEELEEELGAFVDENGDNDEMTKTKMEEKT